MDSRQVVTTRTQNDNAPFDDAGRTGARLVPAVPTSERLIVTVPHLRNVDTSVVQFAYYNCFNYSILSGARSRVQLTVGITSPNRGEGKTLAASNLSMSLTLGYRRKTLLVDLNFQSPRIHDVFGTAPGPGLLEALEGEPLRISSTAVDNLYVLPAGRLERRNGTHQPPVGIERTAEFAEIIGALRGEFSFIIVDMPPINNRDFPILFLDPLDGVLVVTEPGKTRRRDIRKMLRHLHRNQVLGFIFNRVRDEHE